ncbi:hypothetical protein [Polyangium aurulentum]|uniref:hypothetical protein n=1 Tax=Polyangium aurulentum TaxID=2567896 RepID=UPI0010AE65DF|nr:hypothetical protein [Polyangium aurulentum]UQA54813.1 hypothetical protein E8A73_025950 [Polyangium aurulentum]
MLPSLRRHSRWACLAVALVSLSYGPPASAKGDLPDFDPPKHPALESRHLLSWHLDVTPFYGASYTVYPDYEPDPSNRSMLNGGSIDYLYRFGSFRMGLGVRTAHVWNGVVPFFGDAPSIGLYDHEASAPLLLSVAHMFPDGVELALTAGIGYGAALIHGHILHGGHGELRASLAMPITETLDVSMRTGFVLGFMSDDEGRELSRGYVPVELGIRKRF